MPFNLLAEARLSNCANCVNDRLALIKYDFSEDGVFNNLDSVSSMDCLLVDSGHWFGVATGSSCYLSFSSDISIDASIYTVMYLDLGLSPPGDIYPTTGKVQFKRQTDADWSQNRYASFSIVRDGYRHLYKISLASNSGWQGIISNIRIFPFIDGSIGTKVFIKSIKFESENTYACATGKQSTLCDKYSLYENPCPWVGSRGLIKVVPAATSFNIVQGTNDYINISINNYGYKKITLDPGTGISLRNLSFDIEKKLNLVGVSGYFNSSCYIDGNYLVIRSGMPGSDSFVSIEDSGTLVRQLGLYSSSGSVLYDTVSGEASANRYETASATLSLSDFSQFRKGDAIFSNSRFFSVGRDSFSVEAGNPNYGDFAREQKLTFDGSVFIDINNPVTNNGLLTKLYYSGDLYDDTKFCIYRRKLDGTLSLVTSVDISGTSEVEDSIIEKDISVRVARGDLIGLSNAALHKGRTEDSPNFSYFLVSGSPADIVIEPTVYGTGEVGAPIFCRSSRRADEAIIDIEFESPKPIESLFVKASLDETEESFNLCRAKSGGLGGGIFVDTYTGLGSDGVQAPSIDGEEYLIDGAKYETNGSLDYCYPGWLDLSQSLQSKYDYTDFNIVLDFVRNVDVKFPIDRVVIYFVDAKNIKDFSIEVPEAYALDGSSYVWKNGWSSYSSVYTDEFLADPDIYLYNNPSVVVMNNYHLSYELTQYRKLDLRFSDYNTRAIRYNVTLGDLYNNDTTDSNYSIFPLAPSPKISEIEVYFKHNFNNSLEGNFYIETSKDGITYLKHDDVDLVSSGYVRNTAGRVVKYVRLHVESSLPLNVYEVTANMSESPIGISGDYNGLIKLDSPVSGYSSVISSIEVVNTDSTSKKFFVDIDDVFDSPEKCIFWNKMTESTVRNSEVGASGGVSSATGYNLRQHDYAYLCPSYFVDRMFFRGKPSYVSYDSGATVENLGSFLTDGNLDSYITNEISDYYLYPYIYVYIDLQDTFYLDEVSLLAPAGSTAFTGSFFYSSNTTSNPLDISESEWLSGVITGCRWLRIRTSSVIPGGGGAKKLSYINIKPNVFNNVGKSIWRSCGTGLTNGTSSSSDPLFGSDEVDYYCVDLGWYHNVTGVFVGPFSAGWDYEDIYTSTPGDSLNLLDSSLKGQYVAFSTSNTSDVNNVVWSALNTRTSSECRWVMVKTRGLAGYGEDEIIVHVDSNNESLKNSYFSENWWSSTISTISKDFSNVVDGVNSIRFDYAKNVGEAYDTAVYSADFGVDQYMTRRDYLVFNFYVSDVLQISHTDGYFRLHIPGSSHYITNFYSSNDSSAYYSWAFSSVFPSGITSGWNTVKLQMSDVYRNGDIFVAVDDQSLIGSTYTKNRMNGLSMKLRVVSGNSAFFVCIDNPRIERSDYISCEFSDAVYIANRDHLIFPLEEFDPYRGSIEFFIKPDWARTLLCNSCDDPRDHTIFRVHGSGTKYTMSLFMTGEGLKFYIYDGNKHIILVDNSIHTISQNTSTHLAVSWDILADYSNKAMSIFVDNVLSESVKYSSLTSVPNFERSGIYTLFVGGVGWEGIISSVASASDAVIENIKVYNYPVYDFSDSINSGGLSFPKRPSDLVEISLDGATFYSTENRGSGLPISVGEVQPSAGFNVYVRARGLESVKPNQNNRISYLKISKID